MSMPTKQIIVTNDPTTPYRETGNLNTITEFSDGSAWSNRWGKIVVWAVTNKTGEESFLYVNLPLGGETSESRAEKLAKELDNANRKRQLQQEKAVEDAIAYVEQNGQTTPRKCAGL